MARSAKRDLTVGDGGTLDVLLRFRCNGSPMDLTGWTLGAEVGDLRLSNAPLASGSGLGWVTPSDGEIELYVASGDVANLDLPATYRVLLTNPGGDPQPYLIGFVLEDTP